jgi:hypothetical protein
LLERESSKDLLVDVAAPPMEADSVFSFSVSLPFLFLLAW